MSNQSHSNQPPSDKDSKKSIDDLTDDLDFWNMETDLENSNSDHDSNALAELEKILSDGEELEIEKVSLSSEPSKAAPSTSGGFRKLAQANHEPVSDDSSTSPEEEEIDQLLAKASAKINAERELKATFSYSDDEAPSEKRISLPRNQAEKIATLACYLAMVGVFTYLIIYASHQHNFDTRKPYAANTPVKGDYASVESIETWWTEPGDTKAKLGVVLIPSATITLDSDSTSGVIRSVFYSYEEGLLGQLRPKGDPLTHQFVDGKFIETGTNQLTVHCTDGFENLAHYAFYRSQEEKRWTIELKEASSIQTNVEGFKSLANAPIEPIQK